MATPQSLVILDEIGRGTSTFDGISLAWSIVEYLHERINCRTFFATHYHELTSLANRFERINNLSVAVREWNDEIAFLHKIVPGSADKSYGIHVARLAGVPKEVVKRADEILSHLEDDNSLDNRDAILGMATDDNISSAKRRKKTPVLPGLPAEVNATIHAADNADEHQEAPPLLNKQILPSGLQLSLFGSLDHPVLEDLAAIDLDAITPIEAMQFVIQCQERLNAERKTPNKRRRSKR